MGGDLVALLRADIRLPQASVHDFGRDMAAALQFLHSRGTIYCDLKPSNVLLDENGRIKLSGFGLSRRLSEINGAPADLPMVRVLASPARGPWLADGKGPQSGVSHPSWRVAPGRSTGRVPIHLLRRWQRCQ